MHIIKAPRHSAIWPAIKLRVVACCSMLQHVAACCSMLQHAAACCSRLQHISVCCSMFLCIKGSITFSCTPFWGTMVSCCVLQCAAVWCSVLRALFLAQTLSLAHLIETLRYSANWLAVGLCVAVCCSMMQCVKGSLPSSISFCHAHLAKTRGLW